MSGPARTTNGRRGVGPPGQGVAAAQATPRRLRPASFLAEHALDDRQRAAMAVLAAALESGAGVRQALRQALDDERLAVGYWLPEDDAFVDVDGAVVEPSGEAVVLVDRGPVAVLVPSRAMSRPDEDVLAAVAVAAAPTLERARWGVLQRRALTYRQALLDAIPDLMFRLRQDGTYLDFAGDEGMLASPAEELIGSNVHAVLPADVARTLMGGVHEALRTGTLQTVRYALLTNAGDRRDFEARLAVSGTDEALAIVQDVTDARAHELERRRLEEELRASLGRLRESRARIVAAGDAERRRLERNLHDGAQQHFVSVSTYLAMAERVLPTDRERAQVYLREAAEQLRAAHEELRELARGIHPIALTQRGLLGAVQVLARRSPVPVELVGDDAVRFPDPVEAALYYVAAEGLANATRHAGATSLKVCVSGADGTATVVVEDDGRGGAALAAGTGLRGLQDRVEALGGSLELSSPIGEGTRLCATIPLDVG